MHKATNFEYQNSRTMRNQLKKKHHFSQAYSDFCIEEFIMENLGREKPEFIADHLNSIMLRI